MPSLLFHLSQQQHQPSSTTNKPNQTTTSTKTMTSFIGLIGKFMTLLVVILGIFIAILPRLIYQEIIQHNIDDDTFDVHSLLMSHHTMTSPTTIIVTGANSGVGLASVQHLASYFQATKRANTTIIMACRSMSKCESAKEIVVDYVKSRHDKIFTNLIKPMILDIGNWTSIEEFVNALGKETPVDIVINNAGVAGATHGLKYHENDGLENHIRINHLGHMYLVHCLWANLQLATTLKQQQNKQNSNKISSEATTARVVVVSSVTAALPNVNATLGWYEGEDPNLKKNKNMIMYGRSKRANLMFASELYQRYSDVISVTGAHPGLTHTNLCVNGCKGSKPTKTKSWIQKMGESQNGIMGLIKMTPEQGALSQVYAALLPKSNIYLGPKWLLVGNPAVTGQLNGSWHHASFTKEQSTALWEKSIKALNINEFGVYEKPPSQQ